MPCRFIIVAIAILLNLSCAMMAQAAPFYAPPQPSDDAPEFSGEAELGYTHLSGNSESETLIAKGRLTWLTGNWTHGLRGETRQARENDDTSAEQYLFAVRERYDFRDSLYLFGFARWEEDRFSGYRYQTTSILGYGRQLLDGPTHFLSLEAGPGYRRDALAGGRSEGLAVGYAAFDYHWEFAEGSSIKQELSIEGTDANVTTRTFSSLTTKISTSMALRISMEIKHNSSPPNAANAHTDRTTAASLIYSW